MNFNPELKIYYQRIFPADIFCKWLSYKQADNDSRLSFREFSFTLQDDVYIRYNSFENKDNLYEKLTSQVPIKFDIGAEYDIRPTKLKSHAMKPVQKELVFDIDVTDYDPVRNCCKETDICDECWYFIVVACQILQTALQEDFGFEHILWVFSGRRGVHCWVCDEETRYLSEDIRKEIVNYFCLIAQNGQIIHSKQHIFLKSELPKSIRRAVDIIDKYFVDHCVISQNILGTRSNIDKFLSFIEDKKFCDELRKHFETVQLSLDRWILFLSVYKQYKWSTNNLLESLNNIVERIKLNYMYLRLDVNVTKSMKHLLKAPFCVHPQTRNICVPFNPNKIDVFQINQVPTLNSILEELDQFQQISNDRNFDLVNVDTRLKEPLLIFYNFVSQLHQSQSESRTDEMVF